MVSKLIFQKLLLQSSATLQKSFLNADRVLKKSFLLLFMLKTIKNSISFEIEIYNNVKVFSSVHSSTAEYNI